MFLLSPPKNLNVQNPNTLPRLELDSDVDSFSIGSVSPRNLFDQKIECVGQSSPKIVRNQNIEINNSFSSTSEHSLIGLFQKLLKLPAGRLPDRKILETLILNRKLKKSDSQFQNNGQHLQNYKNSETFEWKD